jgi:ribonuclease Z
MCLTLADGGKRSLNILGPPGLQTFLKCARPFMHRPDLSTLVDEVLDAKTVTCKESKIHCIPFCTSLDVSLASRVVGISYICETPPKVGRLDVAKAVALGIPKGPLYSKLKSGESLLLPDGRVICPSDVLEAPEEERFVAIVCSATETLDVSPSLRDRRMCSLIESPHWNRYANMHALLEF